MTDFREWLQPLPLVAILRGLRPDEALDIGAAIAGTGFRILEVPLNSPDPMQSIACLSETLGERCLVGAGTVMTVDQVTAVAEAGGRLIVMPHADVDVIASAKSAGLLCVPGVATPTEAFAALAAGADALKLFPAEQIPPVVLKAWRAVLPLGTAVLPVGGITPHTMTDYVNAGAAGFGIGSALYAPGRAVADVTRRAKDFGRSWQALSGTLA